MKQRIAAIIPARGGSKGIPKKNLMDFCGKPLLAWSVIQAINTREIDDVYVTSDSEEILRTAEHFGAKKILRPAEISGDTASSESAIQHAREAMNDAYDIIIMMQPTSPLRLPDDLSNAICQFIKDELDSMFSCGRLDDFLIWKKDKNGAFVSLNYDYQNRGRRQDREPQYVENGSFYLFKREIIAKGNRLGGKIGTFIMEPWQTFEIDSIDDVYITKMLFENKLMGLYGDEIH